MPLSLCGDRAAFDRDASTPDRAQRRPLTSTPRSLYTTHWKTAFSPSPLPVSQVPSLVFPEISPPSQGSGSTPFERQFFGDFSRQWNEISPVVRRESASLSPVFSGCPLRIGHSPTSQDAPGRVSLIDRFISAAANESAIIDDDISYPAFPCQDRFSSPLSDLSDLTSLSSPASPGRVGRGLDLQSTSPTTGRHKHLIRLGSQYNDPSPTPRREHSLGPSTRSSSCACDSDYQPAKGTTGRKRKRIAQCRDGDEIPIRRKKKRIVSVPWPTTTDTSFTLGTLTRRRLPTDVPYHPQFSLLYLRFPVSSYLRLADGKYPLLPFGCKPPTGTYNEPRDALDLYTPRFVKGCGVTKVGVCPICIEPHSRGGKGETVWLSMKFSAYKYHVFGQYEHCICDASSYHLQYAHGISSVSASPFSPPVAFRTVERPNAVKNERTSIQEGKCHKCKKWILVESIKDIDIKVKELYWWKHAATCHQGTHMDGDDDFFLDDDVYRRVQQAL